MNVRIRSARRPWWAMVVVSLLLVAGLTIPLVRNGWQRALVAIGRATTILVTSTYDKQYSTSSQEEIIKINQILLAQVGELTEKIALYDAAQNLSKFIVQRKLVTVPAPVIATSPDPGVASIIIGIGSQAGVKIGQPVITDQGFLMGKIGRVTAQYSVVILLSDNSSKTIVKINNGHNAPGLMQGERGLGARVGLIPKTEVITAGQTIVTSGSEPGIPPDLSIGTVNIIRQESGNLFQSASAFLPVNPFALKLVAVITSP